MAIAFVQGKLASGTSATVSSRSVTLTNPVTSGNMVCGQFACFNPTNGLGVTVSVTDDKLNSYAVDFRGDESNPLAEVIAHFSLPNITNGPQTITASISSGTAQYASLIADEFSGVATSSPLDGHTFTITASTTSPMSSGNITPSANGDLIYGSYVNFTNWGMMAGSGFVITEQEPTPGNASVGCEYLIQGTAAAIAATFTCTNGDNTACAVRAFKAAAVAPPAGGGSGILGLSAAEW